MHELDYNLCSTPGSRLKFRGPLPSDGTPYIAVLGGNETFGKYVRSPYPALLADMNGYSVTNLGVAQAGLTLFSEEQVLLELASKAQLTIFQVLGAQNMSNRLYSVHSRRNDRFLGVSDALRDIYPEVDFSEINFTGHLLTRLHEASQEAFDIVVDELKWAWVQRMRRVLSMIEGEVLLLWISDRPPRFDGGRHLGQHEPRFVDRTMLDDLNEDRIGLVEVTLNSTRSAEGMRFPEDEGAIARLLPGPAEHARIAEALAPHVAQRLEKRGRTTSAAPEEYQSFSINSGTAVKRSATRP